MPDQMTLPQALRIWEAYKLSTTEYQSHLSDDQIQDLAHITPHNKKAKLIEHVILCEFCSERLLQSLDKSRKDSSKYMDAALRKAAATSEIVYPITIQSERNIYDIEIRQSESEANAGLIIVRIKESMHQELEGKTILITDAKKHELLRDTIRKGEAFQRIENLQQIDLRLFVRIID